MGIVADLLGDDVDDAQLTLKLPLHNHQPRPEDGLTLSLLHTGPHDEIADTRLIFQRNENNARGGFRALAVSHDPGDPDSNPAVELREIGGLVDL